MFAGPNVLRLEAMQADDLRSLLERIERGEGTIDQALEELRRLPGEDLGFARLDTHRELRQGFPEAIYAEGKLTEEVVAIAHRMLERTGSAVLATRCSAETASALTTEFPGAQHHERARLVVLRRSADPVAGSVAVVTAGTSDLGVADEAAATGDALGLGITRINDVGVAGLHRILGSQRQLHEADVVIVVAGMEGALASLVGGITSAPVVAVPTSVGYGASFDGLAALLAMLSSCAAGVVVTNIDNGFGAAVAARRIINRTRT